MQATCLVIRDPVRANRPSCALLVDGVIYEPLTRYFRMRNFSLESERGYARAICKLMNWTNAKWPQLSAQSQLGSDVFNAFMHDLLSGTIGNNIDSTKLGWSPSSAEDVKRTSHRIAEFSTWLASVESHDPINPKDRVASVSERITAMRAFALRKGCSPMAHAQSFASATEAANKSGRIRSPGRSNVETTEAPAFPVERIKDLLWSGFEIEKYKNDKRPWMRWNLRDILITLICLYGGARQSEPLHLWVDDVFEDPKDPESCRVLIHEPEDGKVDFIHPLTGQKTSSTRAHYLSAHCGKEPLTMVTGRGHSGWKGGLLTNRERKAFEIFWINPEAGRLFRSLWNSYISQARPPMPNTPWAFLTKDGLPMGTAAYADSFRDAVEKIGMSPSKWAGGTPHALRHRYGQWLNELQISEKAGQVCMHHANVNSQQTYRRATVASVAEEISAAIKKTDRAALPAWGKDERA